MVQPFGQERQTGPSRARSEQCRMACRTVLGRRFHPMNRIRPTRPVLVPSCRSRDRTVIAGGHMFAVEKHVGQPAEFVVAESGLAAVALLGPDRAASAVVFERLREGRGAQRRDVEKLVLRSDGVPGDPRRTVRSRHLDANVKFASRPAGKRRDYMTQYLNARRKCPSNRPSQRRPRSRNDPTPAGEKRPSLDSGQPRWSLRPRRRRSRKPREILGPSTIRESLRPTVPYTWARPCALNPQ